MIPESYGIERVNIAALTAFSGNPRTHSDTQIDQIAASIREFGWTNPILVDAAGVIIAGHGRLAAASRLSLEQVPVIRLMDGQLAGLAFCDAPYNVDYANASKNKALSKDRRILNDALTAAKYLKWNSISAIVVETDDTEAHRDGTEAAPAKYKGVIRL